MTDILYVVNHATLVTTAQMHSALTVKTSATFPRIVQTRSPPSGTPHHHDRSHY